MPRAITESCCTELIAEILYRYPGGRGRAVRARGAQQWPSPIGHDLRQHDDADGAGDRRRPADLEQSLRLILVRGGRDPAQHVTGTGGGERLEHTGNRRHAAVTVLSSPAPFRAGRSTGRRHRGPRHRDAGDIRRRFRRPRPSPNGTAPWRAPPGCVATFRAPPIGGSRRSDSSSATPMPLS